MSVPIKAPLHPDYLVRLTYDDRYSEPGRVGGIVTVGIYRYEEGADGPRFRRAHSKMFDQESTLNVRADVWGDFEWGADKVIRTHVTLHDHDDDLHKVTGMLNMAREAVHLFILRQHKG